MEGTTAALNGRIRLWRPRIFNQQSRQRFTKDRERQLVAHCGGAPSYPQRVLISRIIRNEWDLMRLDQRMDHEELSGHAMRARLAMENRLRLDLVALGLKGAPERGPSLKDYIAGMAGPKAAAPPAANPNSPPAEAKAAT